MYKLFDSQRDIKSSVTPVYEVLAFGGQIFTGTSAGELSIKKYNHWFSASKSGSIYQTLGNTAFASSSVVELMNITYGQSISSTLYTNTAATNKQEKSKVYRLHAKMLLGDEDSIFNISGSDRHDLIFVDIRRNQFKDQIKRGSVSLTTIYSGAVNGSAVSVNFEGLCTDAVATSRYFASERGDYGQLTTGALVAGHVYYQAGVLALVPEFISSTSSTTGNQWSGALGGGAPYQSLVVSGGVTSSINSYEHTLNGIRGRFRNLTFTNQSNLQTSYYFCRLQNDEFNYSSNTTFLDSSQRIIPTSGSNTNKTQTYITRVALLGPENEVLAVGCTNRPIKKNPDLEFTVRIRLDF